MSPILYWTLLVFACGYSFYRGGGHERVVALVAVAGTFATISVHSPLSERYANVEAGALLVDCAVLAAFVAVALVSDRFWPLWVAGLQLTTSLAHFLKAVEIDLMPQAYAAAARFWSYPILIILVVATARHHRRTLREQPGSST